MTRYVAFLRAVNVGGHTVKKEVLMELFQALGYSGVQTFLASGNVIFKTGAEERRALERAIEEQLKEALGYAVTTFVRSDAEIAAVAQYRPFRDELLQTAQALNVLFLTDPLDEKAMQALMLLTSEMDEFYVAGREIYWLCRKLQSDSKFSNALFERKVKAKTTIRGLNTLIRLAEIFNP
jgi:uncharacterized protein (DUF1697 family)